MEHLPVVDQHSFSVRPIGDADRAGAARLLARLWGEPIVVHGTVFRPAALPGFVAERPAAGHGGADSAALQAIVGLVTFAAGGGSLEIVTIDALERGSGIGTALLEAVLGEARERGCRQVRLTTTNDNLDALRFYQRRAFRLTALRPGAVDAARAVKPEIPRSGADGIPIRDEIDLARDVNHGHRGE